MTIELTNVWGLFLKGGPMMWPIAFLSILAITIGVERFLFLGALEKNMKKFKPLFFNAIRQAQMKEALVLCEEDSLGLGNICRAGLMRFGSSVDLMKASMEKAASFEIHALKKYLGVLSFIVNAAPMLGLLGTTVALCVVFHAAQIRSNALNPLSLGDMSSGIWQALVTSAAGLGVGIISFAIYEFTATRVNDMVVNFEESIEETTEILQAISSSAKTEGSVES